MKKNTIFGAVLSTAIIAVTGVALAADAKPGIQRGMSTEKATPATPSAGSDATTPYNQDSGPSGIQRGMSTEKATPAPLNVAPVAATPYKLDSDTSGTRPGMSTEKATPATPATSSAESNATTPDASVGPSGAASLPASPSEATIGKSVVNANGDKIGEVTGVSGDRVIVSVGGFLGIGSHDVAMNWNQFNIIGSGDDMKLQTNVTKDEIKNLPVYKE